MLKIGDFSKLSRISIRMLRHYDEIGLLVPRSTDQMTGYRYYSEDQLPQASRITSLKPQIRISNMQKTVSALQYFMMKDLKKAILMWKYRYR